MSDTIAGTITERFHPLAMVDVDRRMAGLTPAHAAGLCHLSTRTAIAFSSASATHNGLLSFSLLAQAVISHLKASVVPIHQGLPDIEFVRLEAEFGFVFPPDLHTVLAIGLPAAPGFPDWHSHSPLRAYLNLPLAVVSLQIAHATLWPHSWAPTQPTPTAPLASPVPPSAVPPSSSSPSLTAATSPATPASLATQSSSSMRPAFSVAASSSLTSSAASRPFAPHPPPFSASHQPPQASPPSYRAIPSQEVLPIDGPTSPPVALDY